MDSHDGNFTEPKIDRVEPGRILIKPISQVLLRIKQSDQKDRFDETVDHVLRWLAGRAGRPLPEAAWNRQGFETSEIGAQRVAAVAISDPRYWAARVDDADRTVARRTWVTEASVAKDIDGHVLFGIRLTCTMRGDILPVDRTVPVFVREIVRSGGVELDGRPITSAPWVVNSEEDVDELVDLLENRQRTCSVIALATAFSSDDSSTTAIPADDLLRRVMGAAHVVILTSSASRMLIHRVGPELSLYRQGVRIYRPGFNRVVDKPWRHLLYAARRIADWPEDGINGFERWIASRAIETTVQGAVNREERLPGFNFVRQAAAQIERKRTRDAGGSAEDLLKLFEEDNNQLRTEISEQTARFNSALQDMEQEHDDAQRDVQEAKALTFSLRERIRSLEGRLTELGNTKKTAIPESIDGFEKWCQEHLGGLVEVHSRALNSVKKSVYRDPALIFRALLLLRDFYVPMRRLGGKEVVDAFDAQCQLLDMENSLVGEATQRYRDEYTVRWNGEPHVLNWHLKSGDARERTKCFRLYYFWDEEAECVVVGSMPAHLKSDLT